MPYGMTWWVEDGYLAVVLAFIWFGLDQRRIATKDIVDRVHKNVFFFWFGGGCVGWLLEDFFPL